VSELEVSLEELSAAKSLLETQMSEIEVERDQIKEKLKEVETSARNVSNELEVMTYLIFILLNFILKFDFLLKTQNLFNSNDPKVRLLNLELV
jgi:predicted DNA-binding ArsR family transcriptional regulator